MEKIIPMPNGNRGRLQLLRGGLFYFWVLWHNTPMSKAVSAITKPLNKLGPIGDVLTAVGLTAIGQPELIPVVSGLKSYGATGNVLSGLAAGAGSYFGSQFGGNILGDLGTVGGGASNIFGGEAANSVFNKLGSFAGNAAASNLFNVPIANALGGYAGNALGAGLFSSSGQQQAKKPAGFVPSRQSEQEAPTSLQGFGSLNPNQQSTNLATQGVYGGGLGPQEQNYFLNLINRQVVDDGGNVQEGQIDPIESSYLQNLGLGGHDNPRDLLEAISKWKAA